jgi:hypothetical protein
MITITLRDEITDTEIRLTKVTRAFSTDNETKVYRIMPDGREGLTTYSYCFITSIIAE